MNRFRRKKRKGRDIILHSRPFIELNALTTTPCNWQRVVGKKGAEFPANPPSMEYFTGTGNPSISTFALFVEIYPESLPAPAYIYLPTGCAFESRSLDGDVLDGCSRWSLRGMDTRHCPSDGCVYVYIYIEV